MARFQTTDGTQIASICLDNAPNRTGGQKSLDLVYTKADDLVTGGTFLSVDARTNRKRGITPFKMTVLAGAQGKTWVYPASSEDPVLTVRVGRVTNHANFTVDLFAELLGRSESPKRLKAYEAALDPDNNNVPDDKNYMGRLKKQPLMQKTRPLPDGEWNCGEHLRTNVGGLFGKMSVGEPARYYDTEKLKKLSKADQGDVLRALSSAKLKQGVDKILSLLNGGTPVRVFCSHHYPVGVSGGVVKASNHTHYLSIVGHGTKDGKQFFLCINPWPGGSRLTYTSGIFGNVESAFMGLLEFTGDTLATPINASNQTDYLVLAGP